ncbi:hypothetical protein ACER0C_007543 [Sarotherodon galilaeus]
MLLVELHLEKIQCALFHSPLKRLYEFSNEARMASLGTEAMNLALSVPGSSHLEATIESQ